MTVDPHMMTGPYALGALEDDERAAFEQHLATCAECAAEVRGFEETAARLGDAVAVTPPPALRDAVLAAAARTPQERPTVTALRGRRRPLRQALAAAAVAAVAVGALGYGLDQHRDAEQARAQQDQVSSVLAASDAVLASTAVQGGGTVKVVVSPAQDRAVMVLSGLPELGDDRDYQMWTQQGDAMVSAGVVPRDEQGAVGTHVMDGLDGVSAVALTVEPAGGSDGPSSDPIALLETPSA